MKKTDTNKGNISAFPYCVNENFKFAEDGMTYLDYAAIHSPITFEIAKQIWGSENIKLSKQSDCETFFAVWAYANYAWAKAMLEERNRNGENEDSESTE